MSYNATYEFSLIFPFTRWTIIITETVSAAESHFYSDDYWLRFRDNEQENRGRRKRGRMEEEEEQSDENHPTHSELNQEKTRLKTQRPNFKRIVLKGDFFFLNGFWWKSPEYFPFATDDITSSSGKYDWFLFIPVPLSTLDRNSAKTLPYISTKSYFLSVLHPFLLCYALITQFTIK